MVTSRKLSKIDPYLLWNTIRKLALLIMSLHSRESTIDPSTLIATRTADDWFGLALRAGQLFIAVATFLFILKDESCNFYRAKKLLNVWNFVCS